MSRSKNPIVTYDKVSAYPCPACDAGHASICVCDFCRLKGVMRFNIATGLYDHTSLMSSLAGHVGDYGPAMCTDVTAACNCNECRLPALGDYHPTVGAARGWACDVATDGIAYTYDPTPISTFEDRTPALNYLRVDELPEEP